MSADAPIATRKAELSPRSSAKLWIYRSLAAIGIPALFLLCLEGGLRFAGFGHSAHFLIPDDQPGHFRTNPDFVSLFLPGYFDLRPINFGVIAHKPSNTVRIVVLGESAAQGIPAPAFAFAPQLRAQLRARYPGKNIEVINTGIVAINSHVVYQIARDLAGFSPDLFLIYMGNNEVVGPFGPGCSYLSEMPPLWLIRLSVFVRSTRTGQAMTAIMEKLARRGRTPAEWGGMAMFVDNAVGGDDPRLDAVYRNFEANLRDIVRVATNAGAKTLLCTVVSNLKDCAPLLSRHRAGLSPAELEKWQRVFYRGKLEWKLGESAASRADLQEALSIDPHYADTSFMLGSLELQAGEIAAARAHFIAAEHWDALRFRPDPRINEIIRDVAHRDRRITLLDAATIMGSDPNSTAAPAGRELLFEHVHFDWDGNFQLARLMALSSEKILFGDGNSPATSLDSAGCAAAVGYTAHERFSVLQRSASIVQNPPFTNQLTYCEDEAGLAHEMAAARADSVDPEKIKRAKEVVHAVAANDPENPMLAKLEEDIDDDLGDVAGALAQSRRTQQLQPKNFALAADEAIKLSRLDRFDEAEALLKKTARTCSPRDLALMAPAFADFFRRTKRFEDGRRFFDRAIAQNPSEASLRLLRGRFARSAGDTVAAEREFRAILTNNPKSQNALEELVSMLSASGQSAAAEKECLLASEHQPGNQANNFRAAIIHENRGDDGDVIRYLLAAERSGPVTSGVELKLARKFFNARKLDETLLHLAEAKRISVYEGDPAITQSTQEVIEKLRSAMR